MDFPQNTKNRVAFWSSNPTPGHISRKHMKTCSRMLIIREMQIKTKNEVSSHAGQNGHRQSRQRTNVEKRELLYTVGENVNWCSHYGKQYGVSSPN